MATLADVARRAGVSTATVSRIINNSPKPVTEALRERVLAAVAELQFVPNANAQQLARAHRSAVGVIVHDVSDPYFAEITRGLQRVATDNGRLVIICNSYRDPERELAYVDLLHAHRTAAIILAGSGYHDAPITARLDRKLRLYQSTGGRVAVIGRHEHAGDAIVPENEHGGWLAGDALYRLGHTAVGVIAGPRHLTTTTDRLAGLRRAARDHGHRLTTRHIAYADFDRAGGAAAAAELLGRLPGLTALAALNDSMAVGALACLRERGVDVPGQVSVIGFDDMPISVDVTPRLSTVRLPLEEIGQRAMSLALREPADGRDGPLVEHAAATLVLRDSTVSR
ncbi:LacI family DNA-binding transcriptional regulator [Spirilliplanes yamanashiensis]|uniref:LacI family transcriptional regulator n=1 Tax=Spirilliplanes yamanashiensis TaxID=42233 RepID=A0A8J3Y7R3_9ACTN|nr:LacI family DNA-binding transcriptional regulator [Spirilliplanes yamanashiensis]MDP9817387.1 LacI family transcriptional regulator [Spirilliplanes yamanashiensis]GIJ02962.1 LacI family transcriptional regulator [Spirilliplanes yamanashiensis]